MTRRDALVAKAVEKLNLIHFDGHGCSPDPQSSGNCSNCYGPSPMDASEVSEAVVAAIEPLIEQRIHEARAEAWNEGTLAGWHDRTTSFMNAARGLPEPSATPNPYEEAGR